jgi:hypothetical protein
VRKIPERNRKNLDVLRAERKEGPVRAIVLRGVRLHQVVSELISRLYISGKEENEELKHSDTHQVVSEWDSIFILQIEEVRGKQSC